MDNIVGNYVEVSAKDGFLQFQPCHLTVHAVEYHAEKEDDRTGQLRPVPSPRKEIGAGKAQRDVEEGHPIRRQRRARDAPADKTRQPAVEMAGHKAVGFRGRCCKGGHEPAFRDPRPTAHPVPRDREVPGSRPCPAPCRGRFCPLGPGDDKAGTRPGSSSFPTTKIAGPLPLPSASSKNRPGPSADWTNLAKDHRSTTWLPLKTRTDPGLKNQGPSELHSTRRISHVMTRHDWRQIGEHRPERAPDCPARAPPRNPS